MTAVNDTVYTVPTDVGSLRVRVTGRGPVAVFWHSLFVDSRSWYRVEAALASQRTLVLIDGPSHGDSQPARRLFSLQDCAASADQILGQLGVTEPADWVGSAWGGHVGMVLAADQPERIRSLVAIASPVHALAARERLRIVPLVGLYRLLGPVRFLRAAVADALLTPAVRADLPAAAELVTDTLRHADRRGFYLTMRSAMLGRPDLSGLLSCITAPTMLVAGGDDPMWTAASASAAARHLAHGRAVTIPGSRHLPALEAPDEFTSLITRFWAATGSDATPRAEGS
jgi:pimeloyl-ACP methyl ester carboxylesterase